jgi:hypothetical protein
LLPYLSEIEMPRYIILLTFDAMAPSYFAWLAFLPLRSRYIHLPLLIPVLEAMERSYRTSLFHWKVGIPFG